MKGDTGIAELSLDPRMIPRDHGKRVNKKTMDSNGGKEVFARADHFAKPPHGPELDGDGLSETACERGSGSR